MKQRTLSADERVDWLRLARTPGVGPVTFAQLISRFHGATEALDALPRLARRGGRVDPMRIVSRSLAEGEIDAVERLGGRLFCACEPGFPTRLTTLDPPPPVITILGPLDPEAEWPCAMVGARSASAVGIRFAGDLARELGARGCVIVSGLARGVDGAAHAGALQTGTIAVVGGGVDQIYPREHEALHREIAATGLIVSEMPVGYRATARDFPRRNRLISGLSLGVVVVEAAERSGSLITARLAAEQGREVMAVPGSPLDPRAKGVNRLLRDGAALIENADDVMDVLRGASLSGLRAPSLFDYEDEPPRSEAIEEEADRIREQIAELLSPSPVSRDELSRITGAPIQAVSAALVELELAERCEVAPGGLVRAAYPEPD
ncbi:MAG: DNA-processing protein DprA [Pseudomonadota bacterium]